jgi:aryl-alcohol dehydrogenase-like predicted oxidoreductase
MRRTILRDTDIQTSRLGFGGGTLTLHPDPADAVRLCHAALDAGVTHFDVARQYGFGQAEGVLGRFLREVPRDRVTVATKFGLAPPAGLARRRGFVGFARQLARRSRAVASLARVVLRKTATPPAYGPAEATASLETSLRELGTDHVDLFLAHECPPAQAARDELVECLESLRRRGLTRAFGVAAAFDVFRADPTPLPDGYRVVQFDDVIGRGHVRALADGVAAGRAVITYGATAHAKRLAAAARADPRLAAGYGAAVGADLTDVVVIARLLLGAALADNPGGVVLFGSTRADHVRANALMADEAPDTTPARRDAFAAFVRRALPPSPNRG